MLPYLGSSSHARKMPLWLNFHLNGVLLVPMFDWRWKVYEAVERLRSRYDLIGRSTGAPFLAIVYPPETEKAFNSEWHTLSLGLSPELHVQDVDALRCTCEIIDDIGLDNITSVLADPMPGSDPCSELAARWVLRIVDEVRKSAASVDRPIVVLHQLAALFPIAGPRDVMQSLWDDQQRLDYPVVFLVPGSLSGARTYAFLGKREEFMYRGDLL